MESKVTKGRRIPTSTSYPKTPKPQLIIYELNAYDEDPLK